ncbi:hypothetical protein [Lysobacter capsici]|uniref:hypothetical protein n=1 Tax=Lysobacter capsici TaxID=435897 RepID=UPI00044E24E4|nr:hypothetical protein [Lysobacter capsici]
MAFTTPPFLTAAFAIQLLHALRQAGHDSFDLATLLDRALALMRDAYPQANTASLGTRNNLRELAVSILADYAQIGLVSTDDSEPPRYRASRDGEPPDGPSRSRQPGDGDDGGSGVAEVIAHPVLFCVAQDDFDAAIARALERY